MNETTWQKVRWLGPPVIAALLSIGIAWSSGVTSDINNLKVADAHYDGDLAVINTKIDLLMQSFGVAYIGPAFHQHDQDKAVAKH